MVSLITGGAGFIGSHLGRYLWDQGDEVVVIDNLSTGRLENIEPMLERPRYRWLADSILNADLVDETVARADRVFHLASSVGVQCIISEPLKTIENIIYGGSHVLKACARHGKPVLITSTSEVYGKSTALPFDEESDMVFGPTTRSRWLYACAKAIGEFEAMAYHRNDDLPVAVIRLFNTAGPRQTGRYGMVIPRLAQQALAGRPLTVFGDGTQTRCFCHVADVVPALVKAIETPSAWGRPINLGRDEPLSINELAERIVRLSGSASTIEHMPFEEAYGVGFEDMKARVPDLNRARTLLGFAPTRALDDIIRDVLDDVRAASPDPDGLAC